MDRPHPAEYRLLDHEPPFSVSSTLDFDKVLLATLTDAGLDHITVAT